MSFPLPKILDPVAGPQEAIFREAVKEKMCLVHDGYNFPIDRDPGGHPRGPREKGEML